MADVQMVPQSQGLAGSKALKLGMGFLSGGPAGLALSAVNNPNAQGLGAMARRLKSMNPQSPDDGSSSAGVSAY